MKVANVIGGVFPHRLMLWQREIHGPVRALMLLVQADVKNPGHDGFERVGVIIAAPAASLLLGKRGVGENRTRHEGVENPLGGNLDAKRAFQNPEVKSWRSE